MVRNVPNAVKTAGLSSERTRVAAVVVGRTGGSDVDRPPYRAVKRAEISRIQCKNCIKALIEGGNTMNWFVKRARKKWDAREVLGISLLYMARYGKSRSLNHTLGIPSHLS